MLLNDFLNIVCVNLAVESSFRINDNNGTESAKTEATGLNELNLVS
jgi:hypothetical protein